ncbi:MAG: NAD(P)/FAD-dependent oxidoreductase [Bacilli bacterium]|nr:NAD(P)/FAD-dependent oxidoreductase [Bacilli bacterium]
MELIFDTVVIGGGVAGMSASIYLKRANKDFCILEKSALGGQLNNIDSIHNYPGFKEISGPDLAMNLYEQVNSMDIKVLPYEVLNITASGDNYVITTNKEQIFCNNIIIAIGRVPKRLSIKGEDTYVNKGISFCALCDGTFYKNKNVVVIGNNNQAANEALYLSNICLSVKLISRTKDLLTEESIKDQLADRDNIEVIYNSDVLEFLGDENRLNGLLVLDKDTKDSKNIIVDGAFVYIGQVPLTFAFKDLQILDDTGYVIVDSSMQTKLKNIYAVGDVVKKDIYQIITAASDGVTAAYNIIEKDK